MRDLETERHLATIATLNLAFAGSLAVPLLAGIGGLAGRWRHLAAGIVAASVALMILSLWLRRGMLRRSPRARRVQLVLGVLALALLPLGTAWGAYVLATLGGARGRRLFETAGAPERVRPYPSLVALGLALTGSVLLGLVVTRFVAVPETERVLAGASTAPPAGPLRTR